jgi:hypothetical protein
LSGAAAADEWILDAGCVDRSGPLNGIQEVDPLALYSLSTSIP